MTDTIKSVTAVVNGVTMNLTLNQSTGKYEAVGVAPAGSSLNLPGRYYPVSVTATYETDESTTVDDTSAGNVGNECRLFVEERVKPVVTVNYPTDGQFITSVSDQRIDLTVLDNVGQTSGYSGIDLDTLIVEVGGMTIDIDAFDVREEVTGGWHLVAHPSQVDLLPDGVYTLSAEITDFDGNVSDTAEVTFTCDTVPPEQSISSPVNGYATSNSAITVRGVTTDATTGPAAITISLNGRDMGATLVRPDGSFEKSVTCFEQGDQTLVITATDRAGVMTVVTRHFYYSTAVPVIEEVIIDPNPVDHGATYTIRVTVR